VVSDGWDGPTTSAWTLENRGGRPGGAVGAGGAAGPSSSGGLGRLEGAAGFGVWRRTLSLSSLTGWGLLPLQSCLVVSATFCPASDLLGHLLPCFRPSRPPSALLQDLMMTRGLGEEKFFRFQSVFLILHLFSSFFFFIFFLLFFSHFFHFFFTFFFIFFILLHFFLHSLFFILHHFIIYLHENSLFHYYRIILNDSNINYSILLEYFMNICHSVVVSRSSAPAIVPRGSRWDPGPGARTEIWGVEGFGLIFHFEGFSLIFRFEGFSLIFRFEGFHWFFLPRGKFVSLGEFWGVFAARSCPAPPIPPEGNKILHKLIFLGFFPIFVDPALSARGERKKSLQKRILGVFSPFCWILPRASCAERKKSLFPPFFPFSFGNSGFLHFSASPPRWGGFGPGWGFQPPISAFRGDLGRGGGEGRRGEGEKGRQKEGKRREKRGKRGKRGGRGKLDKRRGKKGGRKGEKGKAGKNGEKGG